MGKAFRRGVALLLTAAALLGTPIRPTAAEPDVQTPASGTVPAQTADDAPIYADYLAALSEPACPAQEISLLETETALDRGGAFTASVTVRQGGLYALQCTYTLTDAAPAALCVALNGAVPYYEASQMELPAAFRDATPVTAETVRIPDAVALEGARTVTLFDTLGNYGGPLRFYLNPGETTVTVTCVEEQVRLLQMRFCPVEQPPTYAQASAAFTLPAYRGDPVVFEAEAADEKTDSSIYAVNDASSAAVSPASPYAKYLNTLGGSNWSRAGQTVVWRFTVPQDGLYRICLKYRQSDNIGLNSFRRIAVDGSVPYAELEAYAFPYTGVFRNEILSDAAGSPMYFALSAGEHTLSMQAVIGQFCEVLPYINRIVNDLTSDYRRIVMITGSVPDTLRDYHLEATVPEVLEDLAQQRALLEQMADRTLEISGSSNSGTRVMQTLVRQLLEFERDSYIITRELADFKSNLASLSSWMLSARSQPLKLDTITVDAPDGALARDRATFWQALSWQIRSFLFTFSSDYEYNTVNSDAADSITVWVTGGTTPFSIMQRLVEDRFSPEHPDVTVNLKLVTASLVTAVISGKGPDVAIGEDPTTVMNYAYRHALVDLRRFADADEVFSRFRASALTPISFDGATYGVPETQSFPALFYRTDVLQELGLTVPETWDDVVYVLSALKKNRIEFGIPFDSSAFLNMIYQYGGTLYNAEQTATALRSREAIEAFTDFTAFFTDYGAPLSYDAQNRIRTGEMPIVLADLSFYNTLSVVAPEINGKWSLAPYPVTERADGSRSAALNSAVTADIVLSPEKADLCWEYLKWWTSADVQARYNDQLEMALGQSARRFSANQQALYRIRWKSDVLALLEQTEPNLFAIPSVPGSYFTTRHLHNAITRVVYSGDVPGDALMRYAEIIDSEITYKRDEFGLNPAD